VKDRCGRMIAVAYAGPRALDGMFWDATRRSDRELTCRAGVLLPEVASSSSLINDRRVRLSVQVYFVLLVARERLCRGWLSTCRERGIREERGREGKFLLANAEGRARRFEPVAVAWGDIFRIRSRCSRSSTHGTVLRSHVVKNFTRVHSEALLRGSAASPGEIIGLFAIDPAALCNNHFVHWWCSSLEKMSNKENLNTAPGASRGMPARSSKPPKTALRGADS
jgi:hypothetical protein